MRSLLSLVSIALLSLSASACSDATGSLVGGQALNAAPPGDTDSSAPAEVGCPADGGMPTWTDLYSCYFSTCGTATCHSNSMDTGAMASSQSSAGPTGMGFVCGTSAASCYAGMMAPFGGGAALLPAGGATDATTTRLWSVLYLNPQLLAGGTSNNMPLGFPAYNAAQIASIQAWVQAGAPNN